MPQRGEVTPFKPTGPRVCHQNWAKKVVVVVDLLCLLLFKPAPEFLKKNWSSRPASLPPGLVQEGAGFTKIVFQQCVSVYSVFCILCIPCCVFLGDVISTESSSLMSAATHPGAEWLILNYFCRVFITIFHHRAVQVFAISV